MVHATPILTRPYVQIVEDLKNNKLEKKYLKTYLIVNYTGFHLFLNVWIAKKKWKTLYMFKVLKGAIKMKRDTHGEGLQMCHQMTHEEGGS